MTYRQWLRTKDGLRFKHLMDNNLAFDIAMQAAWDASLNEHIKSEDKENERHESWCQINWGCNCGADDE